MSKSLNFKARINDVKLNIQLKVENQKSERWTTKNDLKPKN